MRADSQPSFAKYSSAVMIEMFRHHLHWAGECIRLDAIPSSFSMTEGDYMSSHPSLRCITLGMLPSNLLPALLAGIFRHPAMDSDPLPILHQVSKVSHFTSRLTEDCLGLKRKNYLRSLRKNPYEKSGRPHYAPRSRSFSHYLALSFTFLRMRCP